MQWLLVSNPSSSTEQGCPECDEATLDDSDKNTTHPVWMVKHQAAGSVPQSGPHVQGQGGQETGVHLGTHR